MSALNILLKEPVIAFVKKKEEKDVRKVKLERSVTIYFTTTTGDWTPFRDKRMATLPIAEDNDVEVII